MSYGPCGHSDSLIERSIGRQVCNVSYLEIRIESFTYVNKVDPELNMEWWALVWVVFSVVQRRSLSARAVGTRAMRPDGAPHTRNCLINDQYAALGGSHISFM